MENTYNYSDFLCRTCMDELHEASSCDGNPKQQWQSIYDRIEDECSALRIAELLSNAVPQIDVQPSDELPKRICYKCLQQLLSVHQFQQMCVRSEEQMRQQVSKKRPDLEISIVEAATVSEIETIDAVSFLMTRFQPTQEPLIETTEQVVELEPAETSDVDIDKLLEDCKDSLGNFCEFIKNEPIEDDEQQNDKRNAEDSDDGDTILPVISVKDKVLAMELEEQPENETNVKAQRIKHDEDKPYECPYCPRRFKTKSNLAHHKTKHEGVEQEACDICGKIVKKCNLKRHKLTHGGEKPHKCHLCEKSFSTMSNLRAHIPRHTGEKPYKCKYCERSFSQNPDRMKHMRLHLGDNVHRCELCPLDFPVASELRAHFITHKDEDPETRDRNMKALKEAEAQLEIKAKEYVKAHHITHVENTPYECPYCSQSFRTKTQMLKHKGIHEEKNRVACDICGKSISKRCLKEHKRTHDSEKVHKCDLCEKSYTTIAKLRVHTRKHTGEKPYKCKYCERSYSCSNRRITHMRVHFGDNIHRCELCPLAFPLVSKLRVHLTTHKNEDPETRERNMKALKEAEAKLQLKLSRQQQETKLKEYVKAHHITHVENTPYECPYCSQSFRTKTQMLKHKGIHEEKNRVACDICGKSISKRCLKEHKRTHDSEKVHKCDLCEKSYTTIAKLRVHTRKHTGEKPYKCKYCERSYSCSNRRITHMRVHFGDNIHRCELCPLAFPLVSKLRVHLTTHKNEDPETRERNMKALKEAEAKLQLKLSRQQQETKLKEFKKQRFIRGEDNHYECPHCPRRLRRRSSMYHHIAIHEGLKRDVCDICGKSFRKKNLKQHKLTHSNEKPHKCDFCEKRFTKISNLRVHIRTHTGEKPYKCKYCERSFSDNSHRINHMRIHLGDNVHRCELCPLAFPILSELREHFTSHKNEDPETRERNMKALEKSEAEVELKSKEQNTKRS